jgi:transposase
MKFYCGIDLSARSSQVCVVDEEISVLVQEKVPNELPRIIDLIGPFRETLRTVVESSFNWYWLVDGLQEADFDVCLAHPFGLYMITGAKVKTDRRDAFALAKLLRAGVIPEAYIYPKEHRSVRDLLRRRSRLVRLRAEEYGSLRKLLFRHGILDHSRNAIRRTIEEDIEMWFKDPLVRLHANQELRRIGLYVEQIRQLEQIVFKAAKDRPEYLQLIYVPGVGHILAVTILYEIGDISRFKSARHFSSYCRLVPGIAQSGAISRRGRGSKQGNHYLKWAFTQAAVYSVRSFPKIRRSYDRHLRRHRGRGAKIVAYSIIAHKLAQAVYHILRDGTEYREELLFGT